METAKIIGILAGICTTVAVIPQIRKAWTKKKVADVSILMFLVLMTGVALWVVYGILQKDWPIIATNAISLGLNSLMLYLMIRYKGEQSGGAE